MKSIVVGNLSVGGTGKTPHIEYLIRLLREKKVATLSRGYGRKTKGFILADETVDATTIGDEPFQFFSKFKNISVAVDGNRTNGIQQLEKLVNPEVVLLDDAFQHRKVTAGFYILLTDYNHLFADDFILPFGNLREPSMGKKRANLIIVTKCPNDITDLAKEKIKQKLNVEVPVYFSHIVYDELVYNSNSQLRLDEINQSKLIIAGIANPTSFIEKTKKDGDEVLIYSDHHEFTAQEIKDIKSKANNKIIITTEKDYMRLQGKIDDAVLYYLPIKVTLDNTSQFDKTIIDYVE
jgi:tetraacyldisaccharide 4'-kinase